MLRALNTAATGMEAQELKIDVIANNLANVNTTGFKKSRGEFQDLLYERMRSAGSVSADGRQVPTGAQVGQGVRAVATLRMFTPGSMNQTGNTLDLAIEGSGFLAIQQPNGQLAFTRDGSLKSDSQGRLVNSDGFLLDPAIVIPAQARDLTIGQDGTVTAVVGDETTPVALGMIQLATFTNPAGLDPLGHNLYRPTAASGNAEFGTPGLEGVGALAQGFLEGSNVKVVEEMVALISTQRAYETSSRVIQAADEMLRTTAQLR